MVLQNNCITISGSYEEFVHVAALFKMWTPVYFKIQFFNVTVIVLLVPEMYCCYVLFHTKQLKVWEPATGHLPKLELKYLFLIKLIPQFVTQLGM